MVTNRLAAQLTREIVIDEVRQVARHTAQTVDQTNQQQWASYLRQLLQKPLIPTLLPPST